MDLLGDLLMGREPVPPLGEKERQHCCNGRGGQKRWDQPTGAVQWSHLCSQDVAGNVDRAFPMGRLFRLQFFQCLEDRTHTLSLFPQPGSEVLSSFTIKEKERL